jgi:predicted lipoprotein with Yx(FWY)xxD motif
MERHRTSLLSRLLSLVGVAAGALALAACGSNGYGGSSGGKSGATSAPAAAGANAVDVSNVNGVGQVLVDSGGHALYMADQEANGTILCTDQCLQFWKPLMATSDQPTAPSGVSGLGVVQRPDGTKQVTSGGHPLYIFVQDTAGKVTGDGFSDSFGTQHFTWHVAHADASMSQSPSPSPAPSQAPAPSQSPATSATGYGGY